MTVVWGPWSGFCPTSAGGPTSHPVLGIEVSSYWREDAVWCSIRWSYRRRTSTGLPPAGAAIGDPALQSPPLSLQPGVCGPVGGLLPCTATGTGFMSSPPTSTCCRSPSGITCRAAWSPARSAAICRTTRRCTCRRSGRCCSPTVWWPAGVAGTRTIGFVPDVLMDDPADTKARLLAAFRRLLDAFDFEHLLLCARRPGHRHRPGASSRA